MKKILSILLCLIMLVSMNSFGFADGTMVQTIENDYMEPDYIRNGASVPASPFGFVVQQLLPLPRSSATTVRVRPDQMGTVTNNSGSVYLKWYMDEDGYFTISFERQGVYSFQIIDIDSNNRDASFGGVIIGAGGGGGGAIFEDGNNAREENVGAGGSGGDVELKEWTEFGSGWKLTDFTSAQTVTVGAGGPGGTAWEICFCNGTNCPLHPPGDFKQAYGKNDGMDGGETKFGGITAKGGAGGSCHGLDAPGETGRFSKKQAAAGSDGKNAGRYRFWGVLYNCGYGAQGGRFGGDDGPGGDPIYFHEGNLSFGETGSSVGCGKGSGGGGAGYSYSYGHGMVTGTGTGTGRGSYSIMHFTGDALGGDKDCFNGYIYLEGRARVNYTPSRPTIAKIMLEGITMSHSGGNIVPKIVWASQNTKVAKVSPTGWVSIKQNGEAVITATEVDYNVQGIYVVRWPSDNWYFANTPITINEPENFSQEGDTATLTASLSGDYTPQDIFWFSTESAVATVDSKSGEASIEMLARKTGSYAGAIIATLPDGWSASYIVGEPGATSSAKDNQTADGNDPFPAPYNTTRRG